MTALTSPTFHSTGPTVPIASGEQNAQFPVGIARASLRRGFLINCLYYSMTQRIGLGARAGDLRGDGAPPLPRRDPQSDRAIKTCPRAAMRTQRRSVAMRQTSAISRFLAR